VEVIVEVIAEVSVGVKEGVSVDGEETETDLFDVMV
jgi:hypothetical protein